jgi:GWxTD domain-containing protein
MAKTLAVLFPMFFFWIFPAGQITGPGKLSDRYRLWLDEEVVHIITAKERDVFLQLGLDKNRDLFIEAFWKQRDPTAGTPRNEVKEEHYRRLQYANKTFGRGSPLPGWKTDRGRIYIILGPPKNIEQYDSVNNVNPVEIWFYQEDEASRLPPAFNVIFFKRNGIGDYVLYSPVQDGPRSLIATAMGDFRDEQAYQELRKLEPNLASQTLSLIPGENRPAGMPSLMSETLLANIFDSPRTKVKDSYAEALLRYKDVIEVEYSANYIDANAFLYVSRSGDGPFLVHYSIEPGHLTLTSLGGRNSASFELNGRVTDQQGRTVYQFEKTFPVDLDDDGLRAIRATSLEFQDFFPCVPGRFRFDLLLKNTVSKEFSSFAAEIDIPEVQAGPAMGNLFLGYAAETAPARTAEAVPFRIEGRQLLGDGRQRFVLSDTLMIVFQAFWLPEVWKSGGQIRYVFLKEGTPVLTQIRTFAETGSADTFFLNQPLAGFKPGYYDLEVSLLDASGKERARRTGAFAVGTAGSLPRPRIMSKVLAAGYPEEWDYAQGIQYLSLGKPAEAGRLLARAFERNPQSERFAVGYGQCLFLSGQYAKAKDVLQPLAGRENVAPDVLSWLGRACHALGRYREAISFYQDYLSRAGMNIEILNFIGTCHFQLGEKAEALAVWTRSLKINPGQDQLKALVDSLEKK